jgi:hypothetical protein
MIGLILLTKPVCYLSLLAFLTKGSILRLFFVFLKKFQGPSQNVAKVGSRLECGTN